MNSKKVLFIIFICALTVTGCDTQEQTTIDSGLTLIRATQTLLYMQIVLYQEPVC